METFNVQAPDVSTAWIRACRALLENRSHRAFHTVVRIVDPQRDDPRVRAELDRILTAKGMQPVSTVANTIFPAALAAKAATHEELVERYKGLYPALKRLHNGNRLGTYFQRLIDFPGKDESVDQLAGIIRQLLLQGRTNPKSACYEANLVDPATDDVEPYSTSAPIRVPGRDNGIMQFPCLSHCSFQLDNRTRQLHLTALYRSHYMVEKAYGNYLGLGDLLAYVARQSDLKPGMLTVIAGYAQLDGNAIGMLRPLFFESVPMLAA
ncbi:thymidylate synthase [Actinoplanes campanulatus]|uniref:Thymidylate synthase n=1 Tax=Actinoplanes campanulatus TaxID=113559 RepID=A0A7W5ASI0_9ACTN|nr:hypothetical protein [Actinoplanes campanulatus]MBB3101612.1 thymidylate synthase [Actinoplanes campanulatus]GGN51726.1 hypothetical protein GCM10010109_92120 [Actinoplanes campanulatus]GID42688.1 hypothetical protein Aca09nite_91940 [Actinoplanes campanulatus]